MHPRKLLEHNHPFTSFLFKKTLMNRKTFPALLFDKVSIGYEDFTVLEGLSVRAEAGEVLAIMGASGSGKTTFLRVAIGQIPVKKGQVSIFGEDISHLKLNDLYKIRRRMGILFQQPALFSDLNVFENVAFPLREHTKMSDENIYKIVIGKLESVGLKAAANLSVTKISIGMARRIALARAIILDPELIIYDEPFAGLDPISLGVIARLIRDLSNQLFCASVLITHDVNTSFSIADRVCLIGQGRMLALGEPGSFSQSENSYVRQFLRGDPDGPVPFHYPDTLAFEAWRKKENDEIFN